MKTIKQIQQLAENIAAYSNNIDSVNYIDSVRDKFLPLFQFNVDVDSSEKAKAIFDSRCRSYLSNS